MSKIITEFSKFKNDSVLWNIRITSTASTNGLTSEEIDNILNSYKDEENQDFKAKMKSQNKEYDKYPVSKWQIEKIEEIENSFYENLKYEIINDEVNLEIEFQIEFTSEFEKGDVIEWSEGINRIRKAYPMSQMGNIVKNNFNEQLSKKAYKFLDELYHNENITVKKI